MEDIFKINILDFINGNRTVRNIFLVDFNLEEYHPSARNIIVLKCVPSLP